MNTDLRKRTGGPVLRRENVECRVARDGRVVGTTDRTRKHDGPDPSALKDNVTIYHTINGRRTEKKRAGMKVAPNVWHTLHVDFRGSHFTVTLDGKAALEWDDDTFKDAGKVGVWTKADSVTLFDDFSFSGTLIGVALLAGYVVSRSSTGLLTTGRVSSRMGIVFSRLGFFPGFAIGTVFCVAVVLPLGVLAAETSRQAAIRQALSRSGAAILESAWLACVAATMITAMSVVLSYFPVKK
jgi:hypothetical protein